MTSTPRRHELDLTAETPFELCLLKRLRSERKFETSEAWKAQIQRDVGQAQLFFALTSRLVC